MLQAHHLIATPAAPAYCPKPLLTVTGTLHALDWTCRYLEGGPKVYAFHTLNLRTRACAQTIATDKSTDTVFHHCLTTWKTLGAGRQCILHIQPPVHVTQKRLHHRQYFAKICADFP